VRCGRHNLLALLVLGVAVASLVGCGSDVKQEGQQLRAQSLLASSPPLARAIVTDRDIAKYSSGSVQNAFFSYWQDLQFHSWRSGASWYDSALRRFVGSQQLIGGLETLASYYRSVRPLLYSVKSTRYGTMEVRYVGSPPGGPIGLETIEWRRSGKRWYIESDSLLNEGLTSYAEEVEQERIDPAAQAPSIQAIRAGEAAGRLQAAYLSTLIDKAPAAHRGSPQRSS
jgi:hypothetical protein